MHPPQVCAFWSGPGNSCNCDAIDHPTLRQGCKNFLSLGWNNPTVEYEEVTCPDELDTSPPCRSDGTWPEEPSEFCDGIGIDDDDDTVPTSSPTESTLSPTESTSSPTNVPDGCFSNNYKTCLPDSFTSDDTCNVIWLPTGAQKNCLALWSECTGGSDDSCCGPAKCYGDSEYAACVPQDESESPSTSPTSDPCIVCDDVPTGSMDKNGIKCTDVNLNSRCLKDNWIAKKFCQLSCYNSGNGYAGDNCCNGTIQAKLPDL